MSTFTHKSMINHHEPALFSQMAETVHVWRQRYQSRRELAKWSEPRPPRCRHVLERRRLRGRQAVLAGLMAARPAPPDARGAGRFHAHGGSAP